MGKADAGSAKAIGNRIKAKGLQKVKFYCQMCEKQCRDENGFKCHTMSEAHLRKMQIFASNSSKYLEDFSKTFEKGFLDILSRRHNVKLVSANMVYNEYIQDREHIHMNSTNWTSLTQFVQHLAEGGKIVVEDTERGIYIQWVDRAPDALARRQTLSKKRKHDQDDEDRRQKLMEMQMKSAGSAALVPEEAPVELSDAVLKAHTVKTQVMNKKRKNKNKNKSKRAGNDGGSDDDDDDDDSDDAGSDGVKDVKDGTAVADEQAKQGEQVGDSSHKKQMMRSIVNQEKLQRKEKGTLPVVDGSWLAPGIVVKVLSGKYGAQHKKKKGVVRSVAKCPSSGKPLAHLEMVSKSKAGEHVKGVKQSHLETVLPDLGKMVLVVSASASFANRGQLATLQDVDIDKCKATVKTAASPPALLALEYENVCKVHNIQ